MSRCSPTTRVPSTCRSRSARQTLRRSNDLAQRETCAKGSLVSNTPAEKQNGSFPGPHRPLSRVREHRLLTLFARDPSGQIMFEVLSEANETARHNSG